MKSTYRLVRMYFCTWCGYKGDPKDYKSLGNGWCDNVCVVCRQKEQEGATMASVMSE